MNSPVDRKYTGSRMSKIVKHAGIIYLCGQTSSGTDLADIAGQTREVLARIDALLAEAGSDKSLMLSAVIYLRDIFDFGAMNAEWEAWMPAGAAPARTTVEARLASQCLLIEVTIVAAASVVNLPTGNR